MGNLLKKEPVFQEKNLHSVAEYMLNKRCNHVVTMAGAGISTAAGMPDFRSPGSGIYNTLQSYNLPYPEAVFEKDYFMKNPRPFFRLCKEIYPHDLKPTLTHYFIKVLNDKRCLLRHYTQNIDSLERKVGLPENKLIEAHGSFETSHCTKCRKVFKFEWLKERVLADEIPTCDHCGSLVKPNIVMFGDSLPAKFKINFIADFQNCDLLLILGTSLSVEPFSSLIKIPGKGCPRVYINRTPTRKGEFKFSVRGSRDVAWLGDCDEACYTLANQLHWADDLYGLMDSQ